MRRSGVLLLASCAVFALCPFINAAAEYPDRKCPIHQVVLRHREWFHHVLEDTFATMGVADPRRSADMVVALRDGAMVAGYLGDSGSAARTLVQGVGLVVAAG
ncbi:hypothetical protein [Actinacidiphila sp. bgisy167]|uniref:hypothetical protein n=1 Tax=Actinacidiphila sp. bgisy167 TaxID=3413797 RepID=UPI003D74D291